MNMVTHLSGWSRFYCPQEEELGNLCKNWHKLAEHHGESSEAGLVLVSETPINLPRQCLSKIVLFQSSVSKNSQD